MTQTKRTKKIQKRAKSAKLAKKARKRPSGTKRRLGLVKTYPQSKKASRRLPKAVFNGLDREGRAKLLVFGDSKENTDITMLCRVTFRLKECTAMAMMARPEKAWLASITTIRSA